VRKRRGADPPIFSAREACASIKPGAQAPGRWERPINSDQSNQQISLIKLYLICLQKSYELIAKRSDLAMVFLLVLDIPSNPFDLRSANRKCTVAILPTKISNLGKNIVHPSRRIGLKVA